MNISNHQMLYCLVCKKKYVPERNLHFFLTFQFEPEAAICSKTLKTLKLPRNVHNWLQSYWSCQKPCKPRSTEVQNGTDVSFVHKEEDF